MLILVYSDSTMNLLSLFFVFLYHQMCNVWVTNVDIKEPSYHLRQCDPHHSQAFKLEQNVFELHVF